MKSDGIWVYRQPDKLWLKIIGRGNFQNAHFLKEILADLIEHQDRIAEADVDITECSGIDSTFLGGLANFALQMKKQGATTTISGATGRYRELLENTGLSLLTTIKSEKQKPPSAEMTKLEFEIADKETAASTMLEAHETLAKLSEQNQARFQNVIDYLRRRALSKSAAR